MTILSKLSSLIDYAIFGMQMAKGITNVETEICLPKPIKSIQNTFELAGYAYLNFTSYKSQYVTFLGQNAFEGVHSENIIFPNCTSVGDECFRDTEINKIEMPKLTTLNKGVFAYSYILSEELYFPKAGYLMDECLIDCDLIKKLTLGTVKYMTPSSLEGCNGITELIIGAGTNTTLFLQDLTELSQESVNGIIESYADMTGLAAPTLWLSAEAYGKIDTEHLEILVQKNIIVQA